MPGNWWEAFPISRKHGYTYVWGIGNYFQLSPGPMVIGLLILPLPTKQKELNLWLLVPIAAMILFERTNVRCVDM